MNLNYCAEFSPSPAGRSPQRDWNSSREVRERVRVGVSDIAYNLNLLFFNGFAALTPVLSHRERGYIGGFTCSCLRKKTGFPRH